MKHLFSFGLFLFTISLRAQEAPSVSYQNVAETNWVNPDSNWRVVNGTTYNITHSRLWGSPLQLKHLQGYNLYGNQTAYGLRVNRIHGPTVFCDVVKRQRSPQQWADGGINDDSVPEIISQIMVLNYPTPESLVTDQAIRCACMKTTNYLAAEGRSFEAYDCGVQTTNLVPIISYHRVKKTNSVANR